METKFQTNTLSRNVKGEIGNNKIGKPIPFYKMMTDMIEEAGLKGRLKGASELLNPFVPISSVQIRKFNAKIELQRAIKHILIIVFVKVDHWKYMFIYS